MQRDILEKYGRNEQQTFEILYGKMSHFNLRDLFHARVLELTHA
jgi:hypothetical protein